MAAIFTRPQCVKVSNWWGCKFHLNVYLMGEGMTYGCSAPDCCRWRTFRLKWLMFGTLFLHLSITKICFCPRTFFSNNELDNLPWTSFIPDSHTKLRIINRSVLVSATDSPCGVWEYGWTTCLLKSGPLLGGLCFWNEIWFVSVVRV